MWTDAWIGLPYAAGGRGPSFDCAGLVIALFAARHGVHVPDPTERLHDHAAALAHEAPRWTRVTADEAREGDALVFREARPGKLHLGYAVSARDMLHTGGGQGLRPSASRVECWRVPTWEALLVGVYRHG